MVLGVMSYLISLMVCTCTSYASCHVCISCAIFTPTSIIHLSHSLQKGPINVLEAEYGSIDGMCVCLLLRETYTAQVICESKTALTLSLGAS